MTKTCRRRLALGVLAVSILGGMSSHADAPPRRAPVFDGVASMNASSGPLTLTFDAGQSDKLVVVVTGENGNPGSMAGDCTGITYDGEPLLQAVDRNPIPTAPSAAFDQTYNDIWYLDSPGSYHTAGAIVATVSSRGSMTAFALSETAPGVGTNTISPQESKSVVLTSDSDKAIIIASHGMGGDGNSANAASVDTVAPLVETSAHWNGTIWDGHVTGYRHVTAPGLVTNAFTGGNTIGSHTIAAEFPGILLPPPTIEALTPANGTTGAYPGIDLSATFDTDIALTGNGSVVIRNLDAATQSELTLPDGQVTVAGSVVTIDPSSNLLFATHYAIRISPNAIEDLSGTSNFFGGITNDTTWNFTTADQDTSAPVITNTIPADDATGVEPVVDLVAEFDDILLAGAGNITITNLTEEVVETTIAATDGSQVSISGNVLTIEPAAPLAGNNEFAVLIDAGAFRNYSDVPFAGITNAATWSFFGDITDPTLLSIEDDVDGGPITNGVIPTVTYVVSLDEEIQASSVDTSDFGNAGTSANTITTVTVDGDAVTVVVTVEDAGTIQLQINAGAVLEDLAGNALDTTSAILDDTTITVEALVFPPDEPRMEPEFDGFATAQTVGSPVNLTLDASESDKLVVIVTGEHGHNTADGACTMVTYDGVELTEAVDRNAVAAGTDTIYNDIWYLDDPGEVHTAGQISATVVNRGSVTAMLLSDTAPGHGATAVSPPDSKSVVLIATFDKSIVIASHGMGGNGNSANVNSVDTEAPLEEVSAQENGNIWDGHVTGYMDVAQPSVIAPTFVGGFLDGTVTIAAEFPGTLLPPRGGPTLIVR